MSVTEKAAILWREGFIPEMKTAEELNKLPWFELTEYEKFIERRWTLKETVPQIGAKQAKENARRRASEVDLED